MTTLLRGASDGSYTFLVSKRVAEVIIRENNQ